MTAEPDLDGIAPDLRPFAVPLDELVHLDGNPRRGDVEAVARSYATFGQRKPVVARRLPDGTGEVIAGNHQLMAAHSLGWSHIAVLWTDDDDVTAKAFALADNRTGDVGTYDNELLLEMLQAVSADADLLHDSGYTEAHIDDLILATTPPSLEELAKEWEQAGPDGDTDPAKGVSVTVTVAESTAQILRDHLAAVGDDDTAVRALLDAAELT